MFIRLILLYTLLLSGVGFSQVSILAVGDSLTKGHYMKGDAYAPYTDKLAEDLSDSVKQLRIENQGVDTLPIELINYQLLDAYKKKKYDITIFLGGTNDLGYGFGEEQIINDLKKVYQDVLKSGSFLIAMTIPRINTFHPEIPKKREYVNKWIKKYFNENIKIQQGMLFDLDELVANEWDEEFWDDSIHFSPAGYEKIGEKLAEKIEDRDLLKGIGSGNNSGISFLKRFGINWP